VLNKALGGLNKVTEATGVASPLTRFLGSVGGLTQGYNIGKNPLVIDSTMDVLPGVSPNTAATISEAGHALGGSGVGARLPILGNLTMAGINGVHDNSVERIRELSGTVEGRSALAELMKRWYDGAKEGLPLHRNALARGLQYIDNNKALRESIAGKPPAPAWQVWKALSPDTLGPDGWGGDQGSPALQSLINKSRQVIMQ
jgi:hypothetical protein